MFFKNQFTQNGFLSKIIDFPLLEDLTPLYLSGTCHHTEKVNALDVQGAGDETDDVRRKAQDLVKFK